MPPKAMMLSRLWPMNTQIRSIYRKLEAQGFTVGWIEWDDTTRPNCVVYYFRED